MAPSGWLKGVVKSVLSGDTLVVMGMPRGGPPPEKQITLASIEAPRLVCLFPNIFLPRRFGGGHMNPVQTVWFLLRDDETAP